jgi:hypothetical protein
MQGRRCSALGNALWGRTLDDLRLRYLASSPEIPPGYGLNDFYELLRTVQNVCDDIGDPRKEWLTRVPHVTETLSIGAQTLNAWEARREIVRRAIEFLESA